MTQYAKFISVVQRRLVASEGEAGFAVPLLEPLYMIDTHMTFEDSELFRLAMSLPNKFMACEVGSYFGASTCFLAAAASMREGHVHAVDTWQNDAMPHEPDEGTWREFCRNTDRFRLWITSHRGPEDEVEGEVPDNLDMLFLDGDHSFDATTQALFNYASKIKDGGILALHDFGNEPVETATQRYLQMQNRPSEELGCVGSLKAFRIG